MGFKLSLGQYLSKKNKIIHADAIVVVSGAENRIPYAIKLYKEGYASCLILSGASSNSLVSGATQMKQSALKAGIPANKIILEEKATNTYENALYVERIVVKKRFSNLILVTSPYHQRRVYETFKKVFAKHPIQLQNAPSTFSTWRYYNWWKLDKRVQITISESIKMILIKLFGIYE